MAKCSFCSKQIEQGKGVTFVAFDRVYHFCSSKCIKNSRLGRESSELPWIQKSGKGKTKAELKAELLEEAKHEGSDKPAETAADKKEAKEAQPENKEQEKPKK